MKTTIEQFEEHLMYLFEEDWGTFRQTLRKIFRFDYDISFYLVGEQGIGKTFVERVVNKLAQREVIKNPDIVYLFDPQDLYQKNNPDKSRKNIKSAALKVHTAPTKPKDREYYNNLWALFNDSKAMGEIKKYLQHGDNL